MAAPASAELVCGVIWDPRFGPVALVGGGGTAVELLDDVVLALAPLTPAEAEAALRRLRTFPLLDGYRGRPRLAVGAAAEAIAALTQRRGGPSGAVRGRGEPAARHAGLRAGPRCTYDPGMSTVAEIDAKLTAGYTFPSRWYWDPAVYRLELDEIWAQARGTTCAASRRPPRATSWASSPSRSRSPPTAFRTRPATARRRAPRRGTAWCS